jgi:serine/threonine protein kinase
MVIDFGMAVRLAPCPSSENQYPCKPFLFDVDQPLVSCAEHYCWVNASLGKQYRKNYGKIQYIAPEIMREEPYFHPMLCEIWSAGIVLFIMLLGFPPFDYATQADERYVMITSHELAALLESWDIQLDPLAIDLLEKLLNPNPSSRLKIEEILLHPWMQQANP